MANTGFVSCGLDEFQGRCPNGLKVTMQAVPRPGWDGDGSGSGESVPRPRCWLPDVYQIYAPGYEGLIPVCAWDGDNQIAQSDAGPPYLTLFCNDNSWCIKFVNADGSTTTFPVLTPDFDRTNNVFGFYAPIPGDAQPNCVYLFTFTCA